MDFCDALRNVDAWERRIGKSVFLYFFDAVDNPGVPASGYYLTGGGFHDGVAAFPGVVDGVSCIHHNAVQEQATQEVCSLDGRDIAGDADGADTGAKENVPATQCREALWQGDVSQVGTIVKRS